MDVAARVARALERGELRGGLARLGAWGWARVAAARVARPLVFPEAVTVLAVGGATLGGSGKTPLALACAAALAARGRAVALVGHAYGADPGRPRIVSPDDPLARVGDEARLSARGLREAGHEVPVVVAPTRQDAVDAAVALFAPRPEAPVLVLDGVAQTRPRRADLALLAVDPVHPWGIAGACPPLGDLRAPVASLVGATDLTVAVEPTLLGARVEPGGERVTVPDLRALRVGLWTAIARPDRLVARLRSAGIEPVAVVQGRDHALPRRPPAPHPDLWLMTPKCAEHLREARALARRGAPVAVTEQSIELPAELRARLAHL